MNEIQRAAAAATRSIHAGGRWAAAMPFVIVGLVGSVIGAALAFVLDPQAGRTRRAVTGDRIAGGARRVGRWSARRGRYLASTVDGLSRRVRHASSGAGDTDAEPLDEVQLAHKVESILFRDPGIEKGSININAERDVVYLRGTVPDGKRADEIRHRVAGIDGVRTVVNLLRVDGGELADPAAEAERPLWASPH